MHRWMWFTRFLGFRAAHGSRTTRADLTRELSVQPNVFLYVLVGSFAANWYCQSSAFIWTLCSTKASLLSSDFITKTPVTPASSPRYLWNMVSVLLNCRQLLCSRRKKPLLCWQLPVPLSHQQPPTEFSTVSHLAGYWSAKSATCPKKFISISESSRRICHLVKVDNKAVFPLWWFFSLLVQSWLKWIQGALLDCQREDDCNLCSSSFYF